MPEAYPLGYVLHYRRTMISAPLDPVWLARLVTIALDEDLGPGGVLKTGEESEFTYRLLHRGERSVRHGPVVEHLGIESLRHDVDRHVATVTPHPVQTTADLRLDR